MDPADPRPKKYCTHCGQAILLEAWQCPHCGQLVARGLGPQPPASADPVERMLIPVGRPASAIIAGYLGLLSVCPGIGIAAIITSLLALRTLHKHPELSGRGRAIFGLVMGSLMTFLYAVVMIMAFVEQYQIAHGVRP
jgi:hypothetical protein